MVCTGGDELGERVERDGLGVTVPEGDAAAVAPGSTRVLERGRDAYSERLRLAAEEFAWATVAEPLVRFVTSPVRVTAAVGAESWAPASDHRSGPPSTPPPAAC